MAEQRDNKNRPRRLRFRAGKNMRMVRHYMGSVNVFTVIHGACPQETP